MADNDRRIKIETYDTENWKSGDRKKVPEYFNEFGVNQNRYNHAVVKRLREFEKKDEELAVDMQELSDYYMEQLQKAVAKVEEVRDNYESEIQSLKDEQNQKIEEIENFFSKKIDELENENQLLKREIDKLKLTAKLNTNSIDRILKKMPNSIDIDIDDIGN